WCFWGSERCHQLHDEPSATLFKFSSFSPHHILITSIEGVTEAHLRLPGLDSAVRGRPLHGVSHQTGLLYSLPRMPLT
ncbi:hypothetical protein H8959_018638, partial [Pygathrix nigripes]